MFGLRRNHFSLSVVVPVRNDAQGLAALVAGLSDLRIAAQLVVVDDGSHPPVRTLMPPQPLQGGQTLWLRTDAAPPPNDGRGAGHARNLGLAAATGTHVLFQDADDAVLPDLAALIDDLRGQSFDIAQFCHDDSRRRRQNQSGPDEAPDRAIWADLAIGPAARPLTLDEAQRLCPISNYPWNRVWRRDFLHKARIRFTEIPMHNDIEAHWAGFLSAERILASDRCCVLHRVEPGRAQLSNRRDAQRLGVFQALNAVVDRLMAEAARNPARAGFAPALLDFLLRLTDWVDTMLSDPAARAELDRRLDALILRMASAQPSVHDAIDRAMADQPGLAARLLRRTGR